MRGGFDSFLMRGRAGSLDPALVVSYARGSWSADGDEAESVKLLLLHAKPPGGISP